MDFEHSIKPTGFLSESRCRINSVGDSLPIPTSAKLRRCGNRMGCGDPLNLQYARRAYSACRLAGTVEVIAAVCRCRLTVVFS